VHIYLTQIKLYISISDRYNEKVFLVHTPSIDPSILLGPLVGIAGSFRQAQTPNMSKHRGCE
jgi:hypothetical protein